MLNSIRSWLGNLPIADPVERRQAGLLQGMLLIIIGGGVLGMPLSLMNSVALRGPTMSSLAFPLLLVGAAIALVMLRRGSFSAAVYVAVVGLILGISTAIIPSGVPNSSLALFALSVPVTVAGLVKGRNGLIVATGLCIGIVILIAILETAGSSAVAFVPPPSRPPASVTISFVLIIMVLSLLLDRFGSSLRDALVAAMTRERDLEALRASLEAQVSERTASLEQALRAGEQREADLARTLTELNTSRTTIRELSAPVIPVLPGVLVAPLVGALDEARTADFARQVLTQVERERARQLIIDVTGVPVVDTHVAQMLLRTAEAVRLLGAQTLLVGVRPEVAQTIVALGAHLGEIPTYADLREAVETLVK